MPSVADEVEHTHVADLVQDVFTVVEAREALKKIIEIHEGDEELSELVDECRAVSNSSNNLNVLELCRRIAEMD